MLYADPIPTSRVAVVIRSSLDVPVQIEDLHVKSSSAMEVSNDNNRISAEQLNILCHRQLSRPTLPLSPDFTRHTTEYCRTDYSQGSFESVTETPKSEIAGR